ncbi:hypothetical protein BDN72DRAFT_961541 [Pluteus cervinus]|uniref:Uncharacterized protein n=1 Tax=Pluteus cervinus TaxID=181527 RepID=A0ACD3AM80_9AGAR|nr:hypothetical protein BDN72DRAFT_961541 [Pluteus cervinus]
MPSPPHLPSELEYTIFLLAFQDDNNEAKNLILVAKRVFEWLIPHVFRVVKLSDVTVSGNSSPIMFNQSTYQRYGHHTRHLFIETPALAIHFSLFPNVTNLAYWIPYDATHLPSFIELPLTHLSADPWRGLLEIYTKLTHLDLLALDDPNPFQISDLGPATYPKLTHLCVPQSVSQSALQFFLEKKRCPELRVVALWAYENGGPMLNEDDLPKVDDPRIVMLKSHGDAREWERAARGGIDFWAFADGIIASRNVNRRTGN